MGGGGWGRGEEVLRGMLFSADPCICDDDVDFVVFGETGVECGEYGGVVGYVALD